MSYLCIAKKERYGLCHQRTKTQKGHRAPSEFAKKETLRIVPQQSKLTPLDTVELTYPLRKSVGFNAMVGDVLSYEQPQPYIVEDTEYTAEGTPVLTANKAFVLGYTSETGGIYDKGDCIIFDDFTLDCKYVDFPFKVKSSAIKILTAKNKELLRYTFEFLKYLDLSTDEHKRHYIAETQQQEFILPTAQIIRTIAHAFSALSSRMQTIVKQRDI